MGFFGKLLKTSIDLATLPIDVVKDTVTMGGVATDEESAVVKKLERLGNDVEEMREEADKL